MYAIIRHIVYSALNCTFAQQRMTLGVVSANTDAIQAICSRRRNPARHFSGPPVEVRFGKVVTFSRWLIVSSGKYWGVPELTPTAHRLPCGVCPACWTGCQPMNVSGLSGHRLGPPRLWSYCGYSLLAVCWLRSCGGMTALYSSMLPGCITSRLFMWVERNELISETLGRCCCCCCWGEGLSLTLPLTLHTRNWDVASSPAV